jgi:hypothetical protein
MNVKDPDPQAIETLGEEFARDLIEHGIRIESGHFIETFDDMGIWLYEHEGHVMLYFGEGGVEKFIPYVVNALTPETALQLQKALSIVALQATKPFGAA